MNGSRTPDCSFLSGVAVISCADAVAAVRELAHGIARDELRVVDRERREPLRIDDRLSRRNGLRRALGGAGAHRPLGVETPLRESALRDLESHLRRPQLRVAVRQSVRADANDRQHRQDQREDEPRDDDDLESPKDAGVQPEVHVTPPAPGFRC